MKKGLTLICIVLLLFIAGCSKETKTMVCTRTVNQSNIKLDLRYEVEYSGTIVSKVKSTEKVTSDSSDVLENYKDTIENTYAPYNDIEYYDANVTIEGDTLISTVNIDYSKIDVDKFIELDSANASIFKDKKVNVSDIKSMYEQIGATCEK